MLNFTQFLAIELTAIFLGRWWVRTKILRKLKSKNNYVGCFSIAKVKKGILRINFHLTLRKILRNVKIWLRDGIYLYHMIDITENIWRSKMLESLVRCFFIILSLIIAYRSSFVFFLIEVAGFLVIICCAIWDKKQAKKKIFEKQSSINEDNNLSDKDFLERLDSGEFRTYDDVVYHNGKYYENENSEEWEDFEYQYEEDHRR